MVLCSVFPPSCGSGDQGTGKQDGSADVDQAGKLRKHECGHLRRKSWSGWKCCLPQPRCPQRVRSTEQERPLTLRVLPESAAVPALCLVSLGLS